MFRRFRGRRSDQETRLRHREQVLRREDFIYPVFVLEGEGVRRPVASMKGIVQCSIDCLITDLAPLCERGLRSVLVFGIPSVKSVSAAYDDDGIVPRAVRVLRASFPALEIITDVCLCSYTPDGHCCAGDNDATCAVLAQVALAHARAGAHAVAPSDMMDGRVLVIRRALDAAGFGPVPVISYAAKFASNFYGPFRDAAECAPTHGDRRTYQMDIPNGDEAMEEIAADIDEGAAAVIVKPALSYLDIVRRARERYPVPVIAYNVSGEYAMVHLMIERGLAREAMIYETLISMKRAGAERIISYFTPYVLEHCDEFRTF